MLLCFFVCFGEEMHANLLHKTENKRETQIAVQSVYCHCDVNHWFVKSHFEDSS